MKNLRILASVAALAALASAHAGTSIYFGDALGNTLTSLAAPSLGSTFSVSVWYSSDDALLDGEVLLGFDTTAGAAGAGAVPLDGGIGLAGSIASSVTMAPGIVPGTMALVGAGFGASPSPRPYGLSILGLTGPGGTSLPVTPKKRLFDVSFRNLGLTAGESANLSFYSSPDALLYRTYFLDGMVNEITPTTGSLSVQAVPEPASILALAFGAGLIARRRRR